FGTDEVTYGVLFLVVAILGPGPLSVDGLAKWIYKSRIPKLARGKKPTRVVVLGGGFAGVYTAQYLAELGEGRNDVEVELLSEEDYSVFQPLLPEVAAGGIASTHVVNPIRELVPEARFRCCKVASIDTAAKKVIVSQGEGLELVPVEYDHLVFC